MSKYSRKKANKRKKHKRNKQAREKTCSENSWNKRKLRFIAYMLEDDARDFSGVLCEMKRSDVFKAKYKTLHFDKIAYTRISLYVYNDNLCAAYRLLENSRLVSVGGKYFKSPKCNMINSSIILDEYLCVIGQITHETVDQFKGDAKESSALYDSEMVFYQMSDSIDIIVEIYTNDINREFAIAVLDDGWMSDKWGDQFQEVVIKSIT